MIPKHTVKIVKEWLLYDTPHVLHTPPQSPDIKHYDITSKDVLNRRL